jgi:hypothetical protein
MTVLGTRTMKRLLQLLSPLCHSHLIGLIFAFFGCITATDLAEAEAVIPGQLGFGWQITLLGATPILCALGCVIVFLVSPVGNCSRSVVTRGIGRIPILGRYLVFVGMACGAVLIEASCLNRFAFSSIESMTFSTRISDETWLRMRQEVGEGVGIQWRGDVTQLFFLKDKRAAVECAIHKEHVAAKE